MKDRYFRVLVILGLVAVVCGAAGAAAAPLLGMYVPAVTTTTTAAPVCTAPCECMAQSGAQVKWGANGFTQCSKTVCDRGSIDGVVVPFYCFKPLITTTTTAASACAAPCECMSEGSAQAQWGANAYTQCSKTVCGHAPTLTALIPYYCFRPAVTTTTTVPSPCPDTCECMAKTSADAKWGANGYTRCSDTPCGRAPTLAAVIPYYCYKPVNTITPAPVPCQEPCQCMERSAAVEKWGANGYIQCTQRACEYTTAVTGAPSVKYCFQPKVRAAVNVTGLQRVPVSLAAITTTPAVAHINTSLTLATGDTDGDGIMNINDNCRMTANPDQADYDDDGVGDACDNCRRTANPDQADTDPGLTVCGQSGDMPGVSYDDCVTSPDGDGVGDACDNCHAMVNRGQEDADRDGIGNECDNCPAIYNPSQADTNGNGDGDTCEPSVKLLFVPLRWTLSQAEFNAAADRQAAFFINSTPLKYCPEKVTVRKLSVTSQNYNTWTCSAEGDCGVDSVKTFADGIVDTEDYDMIVGMVSSTPCWPTAGCSNGEDTIWVDARADSVTAHELGHVFGLEDEYCSNPAGSTHCNCNDGDMVYCENLVEGDHRATGDVNWLSSSYGCDPTGYPCCTGCTDEAYGVCCMGNKNADDGRCIMSFANAPDPRVFCPLCKEYLGNIPALQCSNEAKPLRYVLAARFRIFANGTFADDGIIRARGRATLPGKKSTGSNLTILSKGGQVLQTIPFEVDFGYHGPMYKGEDYSGIKFDSASFSLKLPYDEQAASMEIYDQGKKVYAKELNFCNSNGVCDMSETTETCPQDCPAGTKDRRCDSRTDKVCDPDCFAGVDPDCRGTSQAAPVAPATTRKSPAGVATVLASIGAASLAAAGIRRK